MNPFATRLGMVLLSLATLPGCDRRDEQSRLKDENSNGLSGSLGGYAARTDILEISNDTCRAKGSYLGYSADLSGKKIDLPPLSLMV